MPIAIQASDLDHARIDGTRVYLSQLLRRFGGLAPKEQFLLYHRGEFNPLLSPPALSNYEERKLPFPLAWMQTRFAWELFRERPDRLFLPIQAAPFCLPADIELTATIHDLAWKRYPETFPWKDRIKLDFLLQQAVKRAAKLIAVSESTRQDLLAIFPELPAERVRVIHHGFDRAFYGKRLSDEVLRSSLARQGLERGSYILYVGALQPRKNLVRLIEAFGQMKETAPEARLVLAGERAWLWQPILEAAKRSAFSKDILFLGQTDFETTRALYQGARVFAFPSLYEGFGLPVLEAFASGTPVLAGRNSSLTEVAGQGALYCDAESVEDMGANLLRLWQDQALRAELAAKGTQELDRFSWDRCAEATLAYLRQ